MLIVFICVGNMCRSPMLEFMFADYVKKNGLDCECDSAGVLDHSVMMSQNTAAVLDEMGIPYISKKSKLLNDNLFSRASLVITMTDNLRDKVVKDFGNSNKVLSLSDSRLVGAEIADPYGRSMTAYRLIALEFQKLLPKLADFVKSEN